MIYLDYAANYPTKKEVLDELVSVESNFIGNANSVHSLGKLSHDKALYYNDLIYKSLELNKDDYEIIHTSSATETNNLAIKGIVSAYSAFGRKILVSEYEHNSINGTLGFLKDKGYDVEFIASKNGSIILDDLKKKLTKDTILVIVTALDSEAGNLNPIEEIVDILKDYPNTHFLCDVTQAISHYDLKLNDIEMFSFTPHKFGGLTGTGLLIKKRSTILTPLIHGGESLSVYRSGSIPLGLIASSATAIKLMTENKKDNNLYIRELSDYLVSRLKEIKKIKINSIENLFIINISIDGIKGHEMVEKLSNAGICVSQKSACSIKNTPSKVIFAMYKDRKRALESFRISLSELVKKEELDELLKVLRGL